MNNKLFFHKLHRSFHLHIFFVSFFFFLCWIERIRTEVLAEVIFFFSAQHISSLILLLLFSFFILARKKSGGVLPNFLFFVSGIKKKLLFRAKGRGTCSWWHACLSFFFHLITFLFYLFFYISFCFVRCYLSLSLSVSCNI